MIRNYLKSAWRNCKSNPGYTLLNVAGLAIGMTVSLIIGLWAWHQYTYDRFLPGYENIYQVKSNYVDNEGQKHGMAQTSLPLATAMKTEVPGVERAAITDWFSAKGILVGDRKYILKGGAVEPEFLDIFHYQVIRGDAGLLKTPNNILLTQSTAKALFGNEDPINKIVRLENQQDLRVAAILADVPDNATIKFDFLFPFRNLEMQSQGQWIQGIRNDWQNNSFQCFIKLAPGVNLAGVEKKASDLIYAHVPATHLSAMLHPLTQWHLYDKIENGKVVGGFIAYVRMFIIIGLLILLIACINFVNLSTAMADKRAKEVGVRKAIGSSRSSLVMQFMIQSFMLTAIAAVLSIGMLFVIMPFFNAMVGASIQLPYQQPFAWMTLALFILIVTILAGSRPAFLLSGFRPVVVLKGGKQHNKSGGMMRAMIIVQFAASVALIIATIVIYQQIQYGKSRPTGYNATGLVSTEMTVDLDHSFPALKNELLASGAVTSVTAARSAITDVYSHGVINQWEGKTGGPSSFINVVNMSVLEDYFHTIDMPIKEGRDFYQTMAADSGMVIVNEAAVKKMNLQHPIGQVIVFNGKLRLTIVGVAKDVLMESPFTPTEPTVFLHEKSNGSIIYRLNSQIPTQESLAKIAAIFSRYNPAYPFEYTFADVAYEQKFKMEVLTGKLAGIFAVLAILVSCFGLLGLAAFSASRRTREIAIRKVMGASTMHLWLLLSRQFLLLVTVGSAIAIPLAWMILQSWLEQYDYRIQISPIVFVYAFLLVMLVTLCTISYQAIKTAILNPAHSLKSE
ncbi:MacB-like protein [Chitinophaga dinghuensis]|uniref:MacB-like protein n=1 Tax=Chitinophaga dinghuensis TaxID=1539050 RepID=A0A327WCI0_9BACT|nr:ABC transporter permease [Chitinophaga dinghuensis]RAJ87592.1 MacB-like protein [Chitinophaga dinghuensis]